MTGGAPRYPGAQPFADDALSRELFFGRETEAAALAQKILANRLVLMFGRSGLGKTSLINAGVAEVLRQEGYVPLLVRFNDPAIEPLDCVFPGVARECRRQGIEHVAGAKLSLWHFFKTAEFWRDDRLLTPVLVLDQFEEIFTLHDDAARATFLDQLSFLVRGTRPPDVGGREAEHHATATETTDRPPAVRVLISMREDFLALLDEATDRIPQIFSERFRLIPMTRDAARRALEEPAGVKDDKLATPPFRIEGAAIEAILDFLSRRPSGSAPGKANTIEPFQLQLICQHLESAAATAKSRDPGREVTVELAALGGDSGLRRVLKRFYAREIGAVPGFFQRRDARRLCSEGLITPGGRRIRMEQTEIERVYRVKPESLKILLGRRLLRAEQDLETTYYELSHDSLIGPVLETQRAAFVLRALVWTVLTFLLMPLTLWMSWATIEVAMKHANWSKFEDVAILLVLVFFVWLAFRAVYRSVRSLLEMLRRAKSR